MKQNFFLFPFSRSRRSIFSGIVTHSVSKTRIFKPWNKTGLYFIYFASFSTILWKFSGRHNRKLARWQLTTFAMTIALKSIIALIQADGLMFILTLSFPKATFLNGIRSGHWTEATRPIIFSAFQIRSLINDLIRNTCSRCEDKPIRWWSGDPYKERL